MDLLKSIILGLFLIGLGGGIIWSVINDDYSIGDRVVETTKHKYSKKNLSQEVRDYGVWDVIGREIFPTVLGIGLLFSGVMLIKSEFY